MTAVALSRSLPVAARIRLQMLEGASLERAIAQTPAELRAAVQSLVYGATRRFFETDAIVSKLASREPAPLVRSLLLVALAELIAHPEKNYAIVNEAVIAAKSDPATLPASGFINACLRRFCREGDRILKEVRQLDTVRWNAPAWWIRRYRQTFGREADSILTLVQSQAPMIVRINCRRTTPADWCAAAREHGISADPIGRDGAILQTPVPVSELWGFAEGLVSVQDAGAQLAARFLDPQNAERILDACAAPGGKTAHLLETADCHVTALEADAQRTARIHENLTRLGLSAEVKTVNAARTELWWDGTPFDRILLDAPCTASGIVRRHPDIVFSRRPADIRSLALQQKELLDALWPTLALGGKLLYVVCSIFEEEGPQQVSHFLASHNDARLCPLSDKLGPTVRLAPAQDQINRLGLPRTHDGFFYALFTKTA